MSQFGFHLTSTNFTAIEEEVEADTLAEAIEAAEELHPGYNVVRGRKLDNDADAGRVDHALVAFKS